MPYFLKKIYFRKSQRHIKLIQHIRHFSQSRLIRNIAIVAAGTAGAQAITMVFVPVITRLYGPEAFGLLGSFMAILAVLTPMVALTYPIAIVLPKNDVDAKGLAQLSILIALSISTLTAAIIFIWGDLATQQLGVRDVTPYIYLIPVAMLLSAFQQILEQWLIRCKHYGSTARATVLQSILLNSAKTVTGFYHPTASALILLQTISTALYAGLLYFGSRNLKPTKKSTTNETANIKELAYRYRDFAIYRAPEVVINAASQSLPVLMLFALFSPASAGFYTLGRTVMGIPASLIGKSIGDVFYPRISEAANNHEKIYPLIRKATLLLAAIGLPPFLMVIILGPWLFSFIFGSNWTMAGKYAQWLAPWLFFLFINTPSIKAIPILKMQAFQLKFTLFTTTTRLIAISIGSFYFKSEIIAVALFGVLGATLNIALIIEVMNKCKKFDSTGETNA